MTQGSYLAVIALRHHCYRIRQAAAKSDGMSTPEMHMIMQRLARLEAKESREMLAPKFENDLYTHTTGVYFNLDLGKAPSTDSINTALEGICGLRDFDVTWLLRYSSVVACACCMRPSI